MPELEIIFKITLVLCLPDRPSFNLVPKKGFGKVRVAEVILTTTLPECGFINNKGASTRCLRHVRHRKDPFTIYSIYEGRAVSTAEHYFFLLPGNNKDRNMKYFFTIQI